MEKDDALDGAPTFDAAIDVKGLRADVREGEGAGAAGNVTEEDAEEGVAVEELGEEAGRGKRLPVEKANGLVGIDPLLLDITYVNRYQ